MSGIRIEAAHRELFEEGGREPSSCFEMAVLAFGGLIPRGAASRWAPGVYVVQM
jgi:hypothetical protein